MSELTETDSCGAGDSLTRLASLEEKMGVIEQQVEVLLHAQQQVALYLSGQWWEFDKNE